MEVKSIMKLKNIKIYQKDIQGSSFAKFNSWVYFIKERANRESKHKLCVWKS